jgi:hypothetical protein
VTNVQHLLVVNKVKIKLVFVTTFVPHENKINAYPIIFEMVLGIFWGEGFFNKAFLKE